MVSLDLQLDLEGLLGGQKISRTTDLLKLMALSHGVFQGSPGQDGGQPGPPGPPGPPGQIIYQPTNDVSYTLPMTLTPDFH